MRRRLSFHLKDKRDIWSRSSTQFDCSKAFFRVLLAALSLTIFSSPSESQTGDGQTLFSLASFIGVVREGGFTARRFGRRGGGGEGFGDRGGKGERKRKGGGNKRLWKMEEEEESGGDGESRTKNPSSLFLFLSCVSISHSHFFVTSPRGGKRKIRRRGGKQGAKKLWDPGNPSPNFQIDGPNSLLGVPQTNVHPLSSPLCSCIF